LVFFVAVTSFYSPLVKADRLLASIPPLRCSVPRPTPSRLPKIRMTDGYEPRAPSALYCVCKSGVPPAWLVAQGGGAVPGATLRSPRPHSPSEVPCAAHALLRAKVFLNPRIRGVSTALRVPCSRIAMPGAGMQAKRIVTQQIRDTRRDDVRCAVGTRGDRVSPPGG
jgi:hypothetical protein